MSAARIDSPARRRDASVLAGFVAFVVVAAALSPASAQEFADDPAALVGQSLDKQVRSLQVGRHLFVRGMVVYPLELRAGAERGGLALRAGPYEGVSTLVERTPLSESFVEVTPRDDRPTFLLAGELHAGESGERGLAASVFVPGKLPVVLPAVPMRRMGGELAPTGQIAPPAFRAMLLSDNPDSRWVDATRMIVGVLADHAPHGRLTELYESKGFKDRWTASWGSLLELPERSEGRMVGFALADKNGVLWIEVFDSPQVLEAVWLPLSRSVVLQDWIDGALEIEPGRKVRRLAPPRWKARKFGEALTGRVRRLVRGKLTLGEAYGVGRDVRIASSDNDLPGAALMVGGRPMHLWFGDAKLERWKAPVAPPKEPGPGDQLKWDRQHDKRGGGDGRGGGGDRGGSGGGFGGRSR